MLWVFALGALHGAVIALMVELGGDEPKTDKET